MVAVFLFDQSSNHKAFAKDALVANRMNMNAGAIGNDEDKVRNGFYIGNQSANSLQIRRYYNKSFRYIEAYSQEKDVTDVFAIKASGKPIIYISIPEISTSSGAHSHFSRLDGKCCDNDDQSSEDEIDSTSATIEMQTTNIVSISNKSECPRRSFDDAILRAFKMSAASEEEKNKTLWIADNLKL
ncbi:hypothetical protein EDC94DRAFT_685185 [Helicostylum pulchrum]|nr:hypothetical protein EDC94DRAFT_685185 [Helicostylum pulchrum]